MKECISHQRGVLYWKSFHITHVNMQVKPHVQSTALQERHTCMHTAAGGQDCIVVVACFHSFIHTRRSITDMKRLTDPLSTDSSQCQQQAQST